jgi:hypothetical protein
MSIRARLRRAVARDRPPAHILVAAVVCLTLAQQLPEMRAPKDARAPVALSQHDRHLPAFLPARSYLLSDCNTITRTNYTTALDLDVELTSATALQPVSLFKLRSIGDREDASALDCDTTTIDDVTQIGHVHRRDYFQHR